MGKIKGWEKTKDDSTWIIYEYMSRSSYYGNYEIFIAKQYSRDIYKNPIKNTQFTWVVSVFEDKRELVRATRYFKTKAQALKFATAYMRSHPRG